MDFCIPDSPLCAATLAHATQVYPAYLLNHCQRSFIFGAAFGTQTGRSYDRELLYVACLLHDMGLTCHAPVETRFEVEGADIAQTFLAAQGVGPAEQELVWDAIALHTTLVIPQRKRAEIALCQLGTAIDVGFVSRRLLPEPLVVGALRAFPRLEFKRELVQAFCCLVQRNPLASGLSVPVAQVGERHVHGFASTHFCDVIAAAEFDA
jgi:hypothetical protein